MSSPKPEKPYAFEMTLHLWDGTSKRIARVGSTENRARAAALLMSKANNVTDMKPLTREEYHQTYGHRRSSLTR